MENIYLKPFWNEKKSPFASMFVPTLSSEGLLVQPGLWSLLQWPIFTVKRPCNQQKTITASFRHSEHSIPASVRFLITHQVRSFIWRRTGCNQSLHYTWLVCLHPNVSDWKCQAPSIQFCLINFSVPCLPWISMFHFVISPHLTVNFWPDTISLL